MKGIYKMAFDKTKPESGVDTFPQMYANVLANFLALAANHAGGSAPSNPDEGWIWLDTTNTAFKYFDGSAWQPLGGVITDIAEVLAARGSKSDLTGRLDVSINPDGTLKVGVSGGNEWVDSGFAVAYISSTQLKVDSDQSDIFTEGRRCKLTQTGGPAYLTVVSCTSGGSSSITFAEPDVAADVSKVEHAFISNGDTGSMPRAVDKITFTDEIILKERSTHPSALTGPNRFQLYGHADGVFIMKPNGDKVKITP